MKNVVWLAGVVVLSLLLGEGCSCGGPTGVDGGCVEPTDWCQSFGKNCGLIPGRCSDAVRCGTCTAPDTCGGNGVENVCGRPGGTGGGSTGGGSAGGGSAGGGGGTSGGGSGGGTVVDGGADAGTCGGRVGCACNQDFECAGSSASCLHGFCTRACGAATGVTCNDPQVSVPGPLGSVYTCWPLGSGFVNLCWPNGSGASCGDGGVCPRAGEACISGACQYPRLGSSTVPRTDVTCHRDGDCKADEACTYFANLDDDNLRAEGACVFRGMDAGQRLAAGSPCSADSMCASFSCQGGTCSAICTTSADCGASRRCVVASGPLVRFAEFSTEFVGWCTPWNGSGAVCASNAACNAGQSCAPYLNLTSNDTSVGVAGACRELPNPIAGAVGTACASNEQCASGDCVLNPLSGRGYCTAPCLAGAADCAGGTTCRPRVIETLDPAIGTDDLSVGYCVRTGAGEVCGITLACRPCVSDLDCNPAQGITCDTTGGNVCRDRFGRCANPCRHDCQPAGSGCPNGTTCVTAQGLSQTTPVCVDNTTGACVRADVTPQLRYEHGRCGDASSGGAEMDLCYYFGRIDGGVAPQDVFACGAGCSTPATCTAISLGDGGSLATTCRTTHEFGVRLPDGGAVGGTAQTPNQCAPTSAF